jgi:hypothetical protein
MFLTDADAGRASGRFRGFREQKSAVADLCSAGSMGVEVEA